jgi:LysR family transcriptional regulator of abg operon
MQLSQIRNFVAVVEAGSLREAARRLGVSQPALTKSLHALEQSLGAPLLSRSARGVKLTVPGQLFLGRARTVQSEIKHAQDDISELSSGGHGRVTLGIASVIGALLVPGTLGRLHAKRPEVEVRVVEGTQETLLPQLREGVLDLAACLKLDSEAIGGFTVRPLARVRLVVAARKGHPLRHARTLAALQHCLWLAVRPRGSSGMLEHAFRLEGLEPPPARLQCDSHGVQLAVLAETDAVALMARQMLHQPSVRDLLEEIPMTRQLPLLTMGLYRRADAQLTNAAVDMAQALTACTRDLLRTA